MESRRRVLVLRSIGMSVTEIQKRLKEEEIEVSWVALYKLLSKVKKSGSISNTSKQPREKKIGEEQLLAIDEALAANDELTARQLRDMLEERWKGIEVSISTVKRARKHLGWITTRPVTLTKPSELLGASSSWRTTSDLWTSFSLTSALSSSTITDVTDVCVFGKRSNWGS